MVGRTGLLSWPTAQFADHVKKTKHAEVASDGPVGQGVTLSVSRPRLNLVMPSAMLIEFTLPNSVGEEQAMATWISARQFHDEPGTAGWHVLYGGADGVSYRVVRDRCGVRPAHCGRDQ